MDQVIKTAVVMLFAAKPKLTLMHNGDAPHTAIAFGQILANKGIAMLPWSSTSLDLNLIDVG